MNTIKTAFVGATIILLALILTSPLAYASEGSGQPSDAEVCSTYGEFAEAIHTARQSNMSLSQVISLMPEGADEVDRTILQGIVLYVYEQPFFQTTQNVNRQRVELRNEAELWCFQNL